MTAETAKISLHEASVPEHGELLQSWTLFSELQIFSDADRKLDCMGELFSLLETQYINEAKLKENVGWSFALKLLEAYFYFTDKLIMSSVQQIIEQTYKLWLDDGKFRFVFKESEIDEFAEYTDRWRELAVRNEKSSKTQWLACLHCRIFSRTDFIKSLFCSEDRGILLDLIHISYKAMSHRARENALVTIMNMSLLKENKSPMIHRSTVLSEMLFDILQYRCNMNTTEGTNLEFENCRLPAVETFMALATDANSKELLSSVEFGLASLLTSFVQQDYSTVFALRCVTVLGNLCLSPMAAKSLLSSPINVVPTLLPILFASIDSYDVNIPIALKVGTLLWNASERLKEAFPALLGSDPLTQIGTYVNNYLRRAISVDVSNENELSEQNEITQKKKSMHHEVVNYMINLVMNAARWDIARPIFIECGLATTSEAVLTYADSSSASELLGNAASTNNNWLHAKSAVYYKMLLLLAFLIGQEENTSVSSLRVEHVQGLVNILQLIIEEKDGADFKCGTFCLPLVLHGIRTLMTSDSNKRLLLDTALIRHAIYALALFVLDKPPILNCGGGGQDVDSAIYALEILVHMSFAFDEEDDNAELKIVYGSVIDIMPSKRSNGLHNCIVTENNTVESVTLIAILEKLLENALLDNDRKRQAKHLLNRLCSEAPQNLDKNNGAISVKQLSETSETAKAQLSSTAISNASIPISSSSLRKHIMVSYSWHESAKPQYVKQLCTLLRQKGVDVWRDEEGSSLVTAINGSVDDCMAEAIEQSELMVICVSEGYKASANCRMEASYASQLLRRNRIKVLYVMMNEDYTTVSSPRCCDGWLGLLIGCDLWYGMWQESQISSVCDEILKRASPCCCLFSPQSTSLSSTAVFSMSRTSSIRNVSTPSLPSTVRTESTATDNTFLYNVQSNKTVLNDDMASQNKPSNENNPIIHTPARTVAGNNGPSTNIDNLVSNSQPVDPSSMENSGIFLSPSVNSLSRARSVHQTPVYFESHNIYDTLWSIVTDTRRHRQHDSSADTHVIVMDFLLELGAVEAADLEYLQESEWLRIVSLLKEIPRRRVLHLLRSQLDLFQ